MFVFKNTCKKGKNYLKTVDKPVISVHNSVEKDERMHILVVPSVDKFYLKLKIESMEAT